MAATDAELAQPPPYAGLVTICAGLPVRGECLIEVLDRLLPIALVAVQDCEVFSRRGPRPRIMVGGDCFGQAAAVAAGQALAMRRGCRQGREPGILSREVPRGAGNVGRRLALARGQRRASQPSCQRGVAEQQTGPRRDAGADLAQAAERGGRAVTRFGDLRFGCDGFRSGVDVRKLRTRRATGGDVLGGGREIATAQLDYAQQAVGGRGVPVRAQSLGGRQRRVDIGGGVSQSAGGQVDAAAQQRQRGGSRCRPQRRAVRGAQDVLRLA